jgi:hypothetical protein
LVAFVGFIALREVPPANPRRNGIHSLADISKANRGTENHEMIIDGGFRIESILGPFHAGNGADST